MQVFGTLPGVTPDPRGAQRQVWEGVRVWPGDVRRGFGRRRGDGHLRLLQ